MELFGYRLGDLFTRFSSGKNLTEDRITKDEKYPVYGGNGLRGYTDAFNFEGECILIGRQGAKCGNVRYFHGKGYMTDHAIVGVCTENHSAKFLSLALAGLNLNRLSGQAAQPGLAVGMLKKQKILLPTKEHQDRIAEIISAYDDLIENNNKRIKILEQMAEELYKEWFVRFRFPECEDLTWENGLTKGWSYSNIKSLGKIIGGGTPATDNPDYWDGDIPWLTPADLSSDKRIIIDAGSKFISTLGLKKSGAKLLPEKTVLLTSRAPIGYVALAKKPICTNQGFKSIVCDESVSKPCYLLFFLRLNTDLLYNYATGATFPELSADRLGRIKIPVPPIEIQERFEKHIYPILQSMDSLECQNKILREQRDILLPKLMSGKLEVK